MKRLFLIAAILVGASASAQEIPAYLNTKLDPTERAKDLTSRLTLEEKTSLMWDESEGVPRLGIKRFSWWSEGLHGIGYQKDVTVFPEPIGMAASFNEELVGRIFDAVSDEGRALYNIQTAAGKEDTRFHSLSIWTPNVNIFRDPRWGRGQETYGEDPYLMGRMGVQVVKGLQGPDDSPYRKTLACAKHYAVHSGPEYTRHYANVTNVMPRDMWETYMPAFKDLVIKGDVREVMGAYQRLEDIPCCANTRLLQDILRDEWGYKYMVVSDCGAISDFWENHKTSSDKAHASAAGVNAGTDVECGFGYTYESIPEAVALGILTEEEVDKHVVRLLEARISLGEFDDPEVNPWTKIPASVINGFEHRALTLEMALQTMTLLKNDGGVLPLKKNAKIAVLGPNAADPRVVWGNYSSTPSYTVSILDGIKSKSRGKIVYDPVCDIVKDYVIESSLGECSIDGQTGLRGRFWNNIHWDGKPVNSLYSAKPIDVSSLWEDRFAEGVEADNFSAEYETVFKPSVSGRYTIAVNMTGGTIIRVNDEKHVDLYCKRAPNDADYEFDAVAGKEYKIRVNYYQENGRTAAAFKLDIGRKVPVDNSRIIAEKLKGIDVVVFVGGISASFEGEEMPVELPGFLNGDRTDIELPAVQRNFLRALKDAGKKVIFVNLSGSAIALEPEMKSCDAILQAWYPGERGGEAVASVLFGDYNPGGKLPITFYKNLAQLPAYEDYTMKGRTYRYMTEEPLFPFGYGLSYTTFKIGNASCSVDGRPVSGDVRMKLGESLVLSVPVTNKGKRAGSETVQVYVRRTDDAEGPIKTLRGYAKVNVAAGKTADAAISLDETSFEWYDEASQRMKATPGEFELFYGNSSDSRDLQSIKVTIE